VSPGPVSLLATQTQTAPAGCLQHEETEMTIVLTPESPEWERFIAMLESMDWCDGDESLAAPGRVHRHAKS